MAVSVNEQHIAWYPGMTLLQVVGSLDNSEMIMVAKLDGRLVSRPDFAATPVRDGAQVELVPVIAGG